MELLRFDGRTAIVTGAGVESVGLMLGCSRRAGLRWWLPTWAASWTGPSPPPSQPHRS